MRDLVPESQAYMDLLAFERKLDHTIMRKRLDIQEALKRPMKLKRKLRIFISNTFYPGAYNTVLCSAVYSISYDVISNRYDCYHRHRGEWRIVMGVARRGSFAG